MSFNLGSKPIIVTCIFANTLLVSDPAISVIFDREPVVQDESQPGALTDVICTVTHSAGKPQMSLSYEGNGSRKVETIKQYDTELQNFVDYYRGVRKVIMRLPGTGLLKCHVTDTRGAYTFRKTLQATGTAKKLGQYIE